MPGAALAPEQNKATQMIFVNYLKYPWSAAAIFLGLKCEKAKPFKVNTQFAAFAARIYFIYTVYYK